MNTLKTLLLVSASVVPTVTFVSATTVGAEAAFAKTSTAEVETELSLIKQGGNAAWRLDSVWDDGLAEFSVYEVDWSHYNHSWQASSAMVVVKEPWAPDLDVKADQARPKGFDVLKFNHIRDAETGIYSYHQNASVFMRRDTGSLRKLTAMSSEACGTSTASLRGNQLSLNSYFDGQGDRILTWPKSAIPMDGLSLILREYVRGSLPESLDVYSELMTNRFAEHKVTTFSISRSESSPIEVPAGQFQAITLTFSANEMQDVYVFDAKLPHTLLRMKRSDGTEYRLAKTERLAYWNLHDPGDESWHPKALLD